ncbi:DUF397 domain-containing protein [Amycolatopsis sp. NPDC005232]|uniref:DUF397 domain-containing protein n=1 Tax=Amycolatopsis sp. NPDC005232 TaxID=3157027 RepID=UPI0033B2E6CD
MRRPSGPDDWRKSSYSSNTESCVEVKIPADSAKWRKPLRSQNGNNCVEVALDPAVVGVRDTKDRAGGQLAVPGVAWRALTEKIVQD